jgi:hypothetical protein
MVLGDLDGHDAADIVVRAYMGLGFDQTKTPLAAPKKKV